MNTRSVMMRNAATTERKLQPSTRIQMQTCDPNGKHATARRESSHPNNYKTGGTCAEIGQQPKASTTRKSSRVGPSEILSSLGTLSNQGFTHPSKHATQIMWTILLWSSARAPPDDIEPRQPSLSVQILMVRPRKRGKKAIKPKYMASNSSAMI